MHAAEHNDDAQPSSPGSLCGQFAPMLPLLRVRWLNTDEEYYLREHLADCAWCRGLLAGYDVVTDALERYVTAYPSDWECRISEAAYAETGGIPYSVESPADALDPLSGATASEAVAPALDEKASSVEEGIADSDGDLPHSPRPDQAAGRGARRSDTTSAGGRNQHADDRRSASRVQRTGAVRSWLDTPAEPAEMPSPGDSAEVGRALSRCYVAIKVGQYHQARIIAESAAHVAMSRRQQIRVWYVLAMAATGLGDPTLALGFLDQALDSLGGRPVDALPWDDLSVCAALAYLRAAASLELQRYDESAEYYSLALEALRALSPEHSRENADLELEILTQMGYHDFAAADFVQCERRVEAARRLLPTAAASPLQGAAVEWIATLLDRWRGDSWPALGRALATLEAYAAAGPSKSLGRIQTVVADIALDLAETLPQDPLISARAEFLTLAARHADNAIQLADACGDTPGAGIARLAHIRWSRLASRNEDRRKAIAAVEATARRLDDRPLLGQALTAMAGELLDRDLPDAAGACFRDAITTLSASRAPALAVWARRALLRASERSDD